MKGLQHEAERQSFHSATQDEGDGGGGDGGSCGGGGEGNVEGGGVGGGGEGDADGGSASHKSQVFLHCSFSASEYVFLHFFFLHVKSFASSAHAGGLGGGGDGDGGDGDGGEGLGGGGEGLGGGGEGLGSGGDGSDGGGGEGGGGDGLSCSSGVAAVTAIPSALTQSEASAVEQHMSYAVCSYPESPRPAHATGPVSAALPAQKLPSVAEASHATLMHVFVFPGSGRHI